MTPKQLIKDRLAELYEKYGAFEYLSTYINSDCGYAVIRNIANGKLFEVPFTDQSSLLNNLETYIAKEKENEARQAIFNLCPLEVDDLAEALAWVKAINEVLPDSEKVDDDIRLIASVLTKNPGQLEE